MINLHTSALPPPSSSPVRISGPFVSRAMATGSSGLSSHAALTFLTTSAWYSCEPWLKFRRASNGN